MYMIMSTSEISKKTGLSERSVRRRLTSENRVFGPTVKMINGKKITLGATEDGVNNWLSKNVDGSMSNKV